MGVGGSWGPSQAWSCPLDVFYLFAFVEVVFASSVFLLGVLVGDLPVCNIVPFVRVKRQVQKPPGLHDEVLYS
ncbi:hypothetical protein V1506DRAFT_547552 [Lipomyces tetrasporus]